jgi:multisubunit Na+/H+ antiporter MnhB subunit
LVDSVKLHHTFLFSPVAGIALSLLFCIVARLGYILAARYRSRFEEDRRPVGKLWLTVVIGGVMMAVTPMIAGKLGINSLYSMYGSFTLVTILIGIALSYVGSERRPLEAFRLSVSATSTASWGILGLSVLYVVTAIQPFSPTSFAGALLCGPVGLLIFVALTGLGAVLGSRIAPDSSARKDNLAIPMDGP